MTTLSLAEARANLSKLVESAVTTHERFEVTRNGDRVAVLLGAEDYDALLETLDILSDADEVAAIRAGIADLEADEVFTADEDRLLLELYAAHSLGLSVSHPRIKAGLTA